MLERMIRRLYEFIRSALGKATLGLFAGVICFAWPVAVAYPAGAVFLYYAIHQFRPVALWVYNDIRADLNDEDVHDDSTNEELAAEEAA